MSNPCYDFINLKISASDIPSLTRDEHLITSTFLVGPFLILRQYFDKLSISLRRTSGCRMGANSGCRIRGDSIFRFVDALRPFDRLRTQGVVKRLIINTREAITRVLSAPIQSPVKHSQSWPPQWERPSELRMHRGALSPPTQLLLPLG